MEGSEVSEEHSRQNLSHLRDYGILKSLQGTGGGAGIKGTAGGDSEGNGSVSGTKGKGVLLSPQKVSPIVSCSSVESGTCKW